MLSTLHDRLRRAFRSWTLNTAAVITLLGAVQTYVELLPLTSRQQGFALIAIGVLMALLRMKTTTSLTER